MNLEQLYREQASTRAKAVEEGLAADERAEAIADARERRLLLILNDAIYWGVIKASLALSVIAALAWILIVKFVPAIS